MPIGLKIFTCLFCCVPCFAFGIYFLKAIFSKDKSKFRKLYFRGGYNDPYLQNSTGHGRYNGSLSQNILLFIGSLIFISMGIILPFFIFA